MQINTKVEMSDLSIAQMCRYAAVNKILFTPMSSWTTQMAWDNLVFVSRTTNELDLYKAVSEIEL